MDRTDLIVAFFKKRTDNSVYEFCLVLSFETPFLWLWTQALSVGNKRRDTRFACVNVMPKIPFPVGSYLGKYGSMYCCFCSCTAAPQKFYSDKPFFFQIPLPRSFLRQCGGKATMGSALPILFHGSLFGRIVHQRKSRAKDLAAFFSAFHFYPLEMSKCALNFEFRRS